jgi:hypothetical protein
MNTFETQKVEETVSKLRMVNHQFDALNFSLDLLLLEIDAEIRKNSVIARRLPKSKSK